MTDSLMYATPYKAEHFRALDVQPAQAWMLPFVIEPAGLEGPWSSTLFSDDLPIVCCGAAMLWPGRAYAWSFLSERITVRNFRDVQRWAKRFLAGLPFRRIEASCDPQGENGHRWLRSLGFTLETPVAEAFEVDGRDASLYALVRDV